MYFSFLAYFSIFANAFALKSCNQLRYIILNHLQYKNKQMIIKNNNIPSCVNCEHFVKGNVNMDDLGKSQPHKRKKFNYKDVVTGDIKQELAEACRNDEKMCGKQGVYYVEM